MSREIAPQPVTARARLLPRCDNAPRDRRRASWHLMTAMASIEKWMYRVIFLMLLALLFVLAYGHIPRGG